MKFKGNAQEQMEENYNRLSQDIAAKITFLADYMASIEDGEEAITWPQIGTMGYINSELSDIVSFLTGHEED